MVYVAAQGGEAHCPGDGGRIHMRYILTMLIAYHWMTAFAMSEARP
jgi:hypothetical protein